jgi:hypothetical protein
MPDQNTHGAPDDQVEQSPVAVTEKSPDPGFPIVGIGASAGGLAAIEAFFSAIPTDTETGMAFVLVQHLAPDHKSILTGLVKRYTRMQVYEVEDGMEVTHSFEPIGRRTMLLNARRISREAGKDELILLAIEDVTDRVASGQAAKPMEETLA